MNHIHCGNKYCSNQVAIVGEVCGNVISSPEDKCDYVNYSSPKSLFLLKLIYVLSNVPDNLKQQVLDDEEINVDLTGMLSIKDAEMFLSQSPEIDDYRNHMIDYLASLLVSWGTTFGIPSELNPDPFDDEGPKFACIELTSEEDEIHVAITLEMYSKSHQIDMLEWYPESLAESLMDEEDLIWVHEGNQIALQGVEVN